ncbi:MAG: Gldg family protein, partial [Spirochaetia bacterium]|nr:Gldg family protein [Spirochaetia bacterium]
LIQVASPEKNIYFTSSNGERYSFTDKANERGGIETLKNMLRFYNYQIKALDHNTNWPGPIPDDAAAVVIAGPTTAFGAEAKKAVLDYLKKNGRLLVAVDPDGAEDFSWLLRELPNNPFSFKKATLSHIPNLPGVVVTDNSQKHRITENLSIAGRSLVVFPNTGYFDEGKVDKDAPKDGILSGLQAVAFVHTPFNTVIDSNRNGKKDAGEASGRYAIGIAIEKPAPTPKPGEKPADKKQDKDAKADAPKIALYAGVGWMTEYGLTFPTDQRNIILATDTLSWLTESPLAAALVPEKRESRSIQVTDELKFRNMLLGMLLFPVGTAVALAAAIAVYRRRRRFVGDE